MHMRALLRLLSLTILLALPLSSAHAASAYVHDLKGTLTASVGAGPARPLKMGDTFDAGVTLATSKDSTAVVKFEDGQVVTLAPDTRFAVQEYNYNKKSVKDSNMVFSLLQGGLRFVTGVIGATNNNKFKLTVATATIGVRGTDGWASYIQGVILAAVNQGALSYTTPEGTSQIPVGSASIARVTATGAAIPGASLVAPGGQIVAVMGAQAQFAGITAIVQNQVNAQTQINNVQIPINTPVVVAAAAQAAQVVATARVAQGLAAAAANNLVGKTGADLVAAQAAAALANAEAGKATALATAAIATANAAAVQALTAAVSAGASLPPAPPPTPAATPLTTVVPTLTTAQLNAQTALIQSTVVLQTTSLQTTQQTLGLPVTNSATIQAAPPLPPPPPTTTTPPPAIPVVIPLPPPTPVVIPPPTPTSPS